VPLRTRTRRRLTRGAAVHILSVPRLPATGIRTLPINEITDSSCVNCRRATASLTPGGRARRPRRRAHWLRRRGCPPAWHSACLRLYLSCFFSPAAPASPSVYIFLLVKGRDTRCEAGACADARAARQRRDINQLAHLNICQHGPATIPVCLLPRMYPLYRLFVFLLFCSAGSHWCPDAGVA